MQAGGLQRTALHIVAAASRQRLRRKASIGQYQQIAGQVFFFHHTGVRHFKTQQGHRHPSNPEGAELVGRTRESHGEDLRNAIARGDFPRWKMQVQIVTEAEAEKMPFNPFDLTKVWPHGQYPVQDVGILELNRNPENYFMDIEQAPFSPSNIVPGIGFSPDKVLQSRVFSYADAHRYRLGTHYGALPVNSPKCPVHNYNKDGAMRFFRNDSGNPDAYYEPNSFEGPKQDPSVAEPPLPISGDAARCDHREGNDDFSQPGALFRLFDAGQRSRLFSNIADAMHGVPEAIVERQLAPFHRADPAYATAGPRGSGNQGRRRFGRALM